MYSDVEKISRIAIEAGKAVMKIYNNPSLNIDINYKSDNSPVTIADKESHSIIVNGLQSITPSLPVLSEEGKSIPFDERKKWESYWCVDPLDGTKEFINRTNEFTINIALIHRHAPVMGLIYIPVTDTLFYGSVGSGSFKEISGVEKRKLNVSNRPGNWVAVGSRSHSSPEESDFLKKYPIVERVNAGSSLKFCLVAEGKAQIYYRHGPTMEWDTAAGHAIAAFSGADVLLRNGSPLLYNKHSLLNESFVCKVP